MNKKRSPVMDLLFTFLLFLVFTLCALTVVLLGARVYQSSASRMEENYTVRTALAYVTEKVRQSDKAQSVSLTELDGLPALALDQEFSGVSYRTYIYFHQKALKEVFVSKDSLPSPEQGTTIVELASFTIREEAEDLYFMTVTDEEGESLSQYLSLKSS